MVVYPDAPEDCVCITTYTANFLWFCRRKKHLNKKQTEGGIFDDKSLLVRTRYAPYLRALYVPTAVLLNLIQL